MIMYLSKSKIDNLYIEASMTKRISIFSRLNLNISFKTNIKIVEIACESGILKKEEYLAKYDMVLKYIKRQKILHNLNWNTYIEQFHYYKCKGYITQNIKEITPKSIIEYKMKVDMQNYDDILFHCSWDNLFMSSIINCLDAGIPSFQYKLVENRGIFVDAIFIIKYVENRTIVATPLALFL